MSVVLPAGLPAGFTVESATGAHAPEVFELVKAQRIDAFGFCSDTLEDIRADLEPTESTAAEYLIRDADGTLAQWWVALTDPGEPIFHAWIASDPWLPDDMHDELSATGWATMFDWIRTHAEPGTGAIEVRSGCEAGSEAGHRRLRVAGFAHRRTFWEMLGPVTDASRVAPAVPGLTITASDETRTIHDVLTQAFKDHWGYIGVSHDDWLNLQPTLSGYDPTLWFLAAIDGIPAAAMILSRRAEADGAMYVQELATLQQYRRRGIASALLAHAFELAAREGLGQLSLHVDSENTDDAPSVYRKAGLEVRCAYHAHICDLGR